MGRVESSEVRLRPTTPGRTPRDHDSLSEKKGLGGSMRHKAATSNQKLHCMLVTGPSINHPPYPCATPAIDWMPRIRHKTRPHYFSLFPAIPLLPLFMFRYCRAERWNLIGEFSAAWENVHAARYSWVARNRMQLYLIWKYDSFLGFCLMLHSTGIAKLFAPTSRRDGFDISDSSATGSEKRKLLYFKTAGSCFAKHRTLIQFRSHWSSWIFMNGKFTPGRANEIFPGRNSVMQIVHTRIQHAPN